MPALVTAASERASVELNGTIRNRKSRASHPSGATGVQSIPDSIRTRRQVHCRAGGFLVQSPVAELALRLSGCEPAYGHLLDLYRSLSAPLPTSVLPPAADVTFAPALLLLLLLLLTAIQHRHTNTNNSSYLLPTAL